MLGLTKSLAALTLGASMLLAGCQANNKPAQSELVAGEQGVMCSKCKTTWVKSPVVSDKGRVIAYTNKKSHVCPDCRAAVTNFFATGEFKHTCKTCGDSMEICEAH